jgi:hypothetical protein
MAAARFLYKHTELCSRRNAHNNEVGLELPQEAVLDLPPSYNDAMVDVNSIGRER